MHSFTLYGPTHWTVDNRKNQNCRYVIPEGSEVNTLGGQSEKNP